MQVFLEPEGRHSPEVYVQGFSTGLPERLQLALLHTLPGTLHALTSAVACVVLWHRAFSEGCLRAEAAYPCCFAAQTLLSDNVTPVPSCSAAHRCPAWLQAWSSARCCGRRMQSSTTTCRRTSATPACRRSASRACSSAASSMAPPVRMLVVDVRIPSHVTNSPSLCMLWPKRPSPLSWSTFNPCSAQQCSDHDLYVPPPVFSCCYFC
jgi:Glucose inhibited division protein A